MAKTALVIDYEPRGIEQLGAPLRAAGYLVTVAKDGIQGLELFEKLQPDITLIEAMLPKKHGFDVCREIKATAHGMKTPVIIVTSVYKGRKYRTQAIHHYGCDAYLEKPIGPESLLETVEQLLAAQVRPATTEAAQPGGTPGAPAGDETGTDDAVARSRESEIADELDRLFPDADDDSGPSASLTQAAPVAAPFATPATATATAPSLALAPSAAPAPAVRREPAARTRKPLAEAPPHRRTPWLLVALLAVTIAVVLGLLAMGVITL